MVTKKQELAHEHNYMHFQLAGMQVKLEQMRQSRVCSRVTSINLRSLIQEISDLREDIRMDYVHEKRKLDEK